MNILKNRTKSTIIILLAFTAAINLSAFFSSVKAGPYVPEAHAYKALKREHKWIYSFKTDFIFEVGDLLIGLGPRETVNQWRSCVNPELSKEEQ